VYRFSAMDPACLVAAGASSEAIPMIIFAKTRGKQAPGCHMSDDHLWRT
jgi:hypothetical protein